MLRLFARRWLVVVHIQGLDLVVDRHEQPTIGIERVRLPWTASSQERH